MHTQSKFLLTFLLTSFIILSTQSAQSVQAQNNDWLPFRSPEGGFRVSTKGMFKKNITHAQTGIGEIDVYSFVYPEEPKAEDDIYTITFYAFPKKTMHSDSTEMVKEFFNETITSAVASVQGELVYDSDVMLHGFYGRQWRVNYGEGQVIRTQAFLVENRYYMLSMISHAKDQSGSEANLFFSSFRLLGY